MNFSIRPRKFAPTDSKFLLLFSVTDFLFNSHCLPLLFPMKNIYKNHNESGRVPGVKSIKLYDFWQQHTRSSIYDFWQQHTRSGFYLFFLFRCGGSFGTVERVHIAHIWRWLRKLIVTRVMMYWQSSWRKLKTSIWSKTWKHCSAVCNEWRTRFHYDRILRIFVSAFW